MVVAQLMIIQNANLRVCGSWHEWKAIHRMTMYSTDGSAAKKIYPILVNQRPRSVRNSWVYCKVEFATDHRPVIGNFRLALRRTRTRLPKAPCYNVSCLQDPVVEHLYAMEINVFWPWLTTTTPPGMPSRIQLMRWHTEPSEKLNTQKRNGLALEHCS